MKIEQVLNEFAEYAHTMYLGCSRDSHRDTVELDAWEYSYSKEVCNMIEGFIESVRNKPFTADEDKVTLHISNCVFCDLSEPLKDNIAYDKNSATWQEHINNHKK